MLEKNVDERTSILLTLARNILNLMLHYTNTGRVTTMQITMLIANFIVKKMMYRTLKSIHI